MTNNDVQQAAERVLAQTAGMNGPSGFISVDVAILRIDHAERMMRAERILAENARIVSALPARRPTAAKPRSPVRERIERKLTIARAKAADCALTLQLEALRRRLSTPPNGN